MRCVFVCVRGEGRQLFRFGMGVFSCADQKECCCLRVMNAFFTSEAVL